MNINMQLEINNIEKAFGPDIVLNNISFQLVKGTTLSVLGKSGCGKTTLLKIIAGLLLQDKGDIIVDGININNVPAQNRNIVYLYQEPLLFPHLRVGENLAFGLHLRRIDKNEIAERVRQLVAQLGLEGQEHKFPHQLSGGQKQRVAFGRAIIINPKIILLDEPFGNLDAETRTLMQELFKSIAGTYAITSVFVTHDLKEALIMGNNFAYMREGKLHLYATKQSFIEDEATGIKNEIQFWKNTSAF